jgi:enoyl-[acyl-carrier protein] reductase I
MGNLLSGKNILIMGVRNKWSIAWGIAKAAFDEGANLIFTYQGEREKESVERLAVQLGNTPAYQCDVSSDSAIEDTFDIIKKNYGMLHGVVHGIAHAKSEDIHNSKEYLYCLRLYGYAKVHRWTCCYS